MVRIKHRWLLINILYPSQRPQNTNPSSSKDSVISINAPTPDAIDVRLILSTIRNTIADLFGDCGAGLASSSLVIKYFSNATSTFILRCRREVFRIVWAAVSFIRSLPISGADSGGGGGGGGGKGSKAQKETVDVVMRVARVSGTIRKCEEEAIRRAKAMCGRIKGLEVAAEAGAETLQSMALVDGSDEDMDQVNDGLVDSDESDDDND